LHRPWELCYAVVGGGGGGESAEGWAKCWWREAVGGRRVARRVVRRCRRGFGSSLINFFRAAAETRDSMMEERGVHPCAGTAAQPYYAAGRGF
jgi:hypothetical protein